MDLFIHLKPPKPDMLNLAVSLRDSSAFTTACQLVGVWGLGGLRAPKAYAVGLQAMLGGGGARDSENLILT